MLALLPPWYQAVLDYQQICQTEQVQLEAAAQAIQTISDNLFFQTMDEGAISQWEQVLQIAPNPQTETLAFRRVRAINRLSTRPPFTIWFLHQKLDELIGELGGMDLYLHCSGIGHQNYGLSPDIELDTLETNGTGFTRMVTAAFRYFARQGNGHIAVISSIAGTKGLGAAPAYSATKRFQNTYLDALEQLACMQHLSIRFTDIRPGFVATGLLNDGKHYPMLMNTAYVARKIVSALHHRRRIAVIDWRYRIMVFFWKLIPPFVWKRLPVRN